MKNYQRVNFQGIPSLASTRMASTWQDPVYTTGDQSLAEAMWMGKVGIHQHRFYPAW